MKMTTEQFLSHLGIEVDKEFRMSETFPSRKYKVDENYELHFREHDSFEWQKSRLNLDDLLDEEIKQITPLPKYTLTEDEKAIVRNIPKEYTFIWKREALKDIAIFSRDKDNCVDLFTSLPFYNLFSFLETGEQLSLDELRKCL